MGYFFLSPPMQVPNVVWMALFPEPPKHLEGETGSWWLLLKGGRENAWVVSGTHGYGLASPFAFPGTNVKLFTEER